MYSYTLVVTRIVPGFQVDIWARESGTSLSSAASSHSHVERLQGFSGDSRLDWGNFAGGFALGVLSAAIACVVRIIGLMIARFGDALDELLFPSRSMGGFRLGHHGSR